MLGTGYCFLIILLFAFRKSKFFCFVALLFLFVLFAFNTDIADRDNYEQALSMSHSISIEPLYGALLGALVFLNLDVQWLYYLCAPLLLLSLFTFIRKYSNHPNYVISIYMICVFFLDVVQNRFSFALIFIYWGFYYLLSNDRLKSTLFFVVFILISTLIHSSSIVFLIFLLAKYLDRKQVNLFVLISLPFVLSFSFLASSYIGELLGISGWMQRLQTAGNYSGTNMVLVCSLVLILIILMYYLSYRTINPLSSNLKSLGEIGLKIATISLLYIPLLQFSADFRRHFFLIFIVLVTISSNWIFSSKSKAPLLFQLLVAVLLFYYFSIAGDSYVTVIKAIFSNNSLLS